MTIKVNIAGTEVPVEVSNEQVNDLRLEAQEEFALAIIRSYAERKFPDLSELEIEELTEGCPFPESQSIDDFINDLVSGELWNIIGKEVDRIIANRAKIYRVTITATQEFDIYVKATSADEAEKYANDLEYHDLSDYLGDYGHEFEVSYTDPDGRETCPPGGADFDATEA